MVRSLSRATVRFRISHKVALALLGTTLVALIVVGVAYNERTKSRLLDMVVAHLESAAAQQAYAAELIFQKNLERLALTTSRTQLRLSLRRWVEQTAAGRAPDEADLARMRKILADANQAIADFENLSLFDPEGRRITSAKHASQRLSLDASSRQRLLESDDVLMHIMHQPGQANRLLLLQRLSLDGKALGLLQAEVSLADFERLLATGAGIGESEEVLLLYRDAAGQLQPVAGEERLRTPDRRAFLDPFSLAQTVDHVSEHRIDYRNQQVIAIAHVFDRPRWGMVFKIDRADALRSVREQQTFLFRALIIALSGSLLIALALSRQLTRPINNLTDVALMIASGDFSRRIKRYGRDELGLLAIAIDQMADRLVDANRDLEQRVQDKTRDLVAVNAKLTSLNEELRHMSHEDQLTGIGNRRAFDERLALEWQHGMREKRPVSILLLDIDHFKAYNDSLGHQAGDACLREVADALNAAVDRSTDLLARYGGEEFAILMPGNYSAQAMVVAQRAQQVLAERAIPHPASSAGPLVTFSAGLGATTPRRDGAGPEAFLEQIDKALYRAKELGRNRVVRLADLDDSGESAEPE